MPRSAFRRTLLAAAVLLGLCALVAFVVLVVRPPCLILRFSHLYCTGCGFSRQLSALLRGRFSEAFYYNAYWFCLLPITLLYAVTEAVLFVLGKRPLYKSRAALPVLAVILLLAVVFMVVRNLPGFEWLAPGV